MELDTLVIKSDSPKVAEWVKRMKAYKAAQLQDMVGTVLS